MFISRIISILINLTDVLRNTVLTDFNRKLWSRFIVNTLATSGPRMSKDAVYFHFKERAVSFRIDTPFLLYHLIRFMLFT